MNDPSFAIVAELVQQLKATHREDYEERAAIMQFEGELDRKLAEALALLDVLKRYPDALLVLDLWVLTRSGETRYLLSQRDRLSADRLKAIGYAVSAPSSLEALLVAQFGGTAMLVHPSA